MLETFHGCVLRIPLQLGSLFSNTIKHLPHFPSKGCKVTQQRQDLNFSLSKAKAQFVSTPH